MKFSIKYLKLPKYKEDIINKLRNFFKAKSNWHLFIIFIVFGISGSLSVIISEPIMELLKIKELIENYILYTAIRILIIFPVYQIVLLFVGTLFGQYKYFIDFEKKMLTRFKKK
tara:strand:+ start:728 stop:1069 length:342 start_codon:yes stop_codon:yes gene_type:complete